MPVEIQELIYQDFDLQFIAHPVTGDVPMLKNTKAIMRSVRNLVLSSMYDSPYNSHIYGGVLSALFENYDPILVNQLKNAVRDVIRNYEPRAEYIDTLVSSNEELDRNTITLKIYVRPINAVDPVEIPVTLERIR